MIFNSNIHPHPENPGPDPRAKKPRREREPHPARPVNIIALLIIAVIALFLSMVLPVIFQLAMKTELHGSLVKPPQTELLDGAQKESHVVTNSTEYETEFVPGALEERGSTFGWLSFWYGPLMLTGADLEFTMHPLDETEPVKGYARIGYRSFATVFLTFLFFLALLWLLEIFMGNPDVALKLVPIFVALWFLYALFVWAIGGMVTSSAEDFFNVALEPIDTAAQFKVSPLILFNAPIRIFFVGMAYWVLKHVIFKKREQQEERHKYVTGPMT